MKAAYFHPIGGASGDMTLAALLDAGLPLHKLEEGVAALDVPNVRVKAWRDQRGRSPEPESTLRRRAAGQEPSTGL